MSILKSWAKKTKAKKSTPSPSTTTFGLNRNVKEEVEILEYLGKGTFSIVRKGRIKKTNQEVAVKIIDKNSIDVKVESLKTEVQILLNVQHPSIVNLVALYEDDEKVYLCMELMSGGELFDRICNDFPSGYSEQQASLLVKNVLEGVAYLHSKGIIHRDLKPENLLFPRNSIKCMDIRISDFGLAKIYRGDMLVKTACGSPNYVAPEVLQNVMHGYGYEVDMWSVGVILYVLLCGFCPFYDENTAALFQAITSGHYSFPSPYWDSISAEAKDLVRRLLEVDVTKRLTPKQALAHPWIGSNTKVDTIPSIKQNMSKFRELRSASVLATPDDEDDSSSDSEQNGQENA